MMLARSALMRAMMGVLETTARKAVVYVAPDLTVKATRQRRPAGRDRQATIVVTIGRPNYAERNFIRLCKRAGEPLPVRNIQLVGWPDPVKRRWVRTSSDLACKES